MTCYAGFGATASPTSKPPEGDRSMKNAAIMAGGRKIVVDEVFVQTPDVVWKTLTTPELMDRCQMADYARHAPGAV
jgi:hypothetical protein